MRRLGLLLLLACTIRAADDLYVVKVTTERPSFSGPARQTLTAVAVPVGGDGLLMAVGFALEAPVDAEDRSAIHVTAIHPGGAEMPAELIGGDADLDCTFFRLRGSKGKMPKPVALVGVEVERGDEVVVEGRYGEVMKYALRRTRTRIDAIVDEPYRIYAVEGRMQRWVGCPVRTPDGKLVGFIDMRDTVDGGDGMMLGVGSRTAVIVAADAYAEAARTRPVKNLRRAWLGVNLAPFDVDKEAFFNTGPGQMGALVTGVAEGSPSDKAGIRVHDLIRSIGPLRIRFEKMEDWPSMLRGVQHLPFGKPLNCRIVRFVERKDGSYEARELDLEMTLEERPLDFDDAPETEFEELGLRIKPLLKSWGRTRQIPEGTTGVVVVRIERASPVQLADLRAGDVVLRVDDKKVESVDSFVKLLHEAKRTKRKKIVFFVRRGTATLFLAIQPSW